MGTDFIDLDSDDSFNGENFNEAIITSAQTGRVEVVLDGSSDFDSEIEEISVTNTIKKSFEPTLEDLPDETDEITTVELNVEGATTTEIPSSPELTPQEAMRKKLADAAESRLRREFDTEKEPKRIKKDSSADPLQNSGSDGHNTNQALPSRKIQENNTRAPDISGNTSRIRMIANPTYCSEFSVDGDKDAVSLFDLVGSPDLTQTYQFNMLIDFDYLVKFVRNKNCKFTLINKSDENHLHVEPASWEKYDIKTIDASKKLTKFGTHHTKMMINFFKDGTCQIVVHTMNITQADHMIQTQMCWLSPRLIAHTDPSNFLDFNNDQLDIRKHTGTVFKRDFIAYLLRYESPEINDLINSIGRYDFSSIDVVFVGSTPGDYYYEQWDKLTKPNAKPMFGYGRLWQVIHMLDLQSLSGKFVCQTSTLAGPCDNYRRNTFVHVLTACAEKGFPLIKKAENKYSHSQKQKLEPIIVWPTEKEVLKAKAGPLSGIALHLTIKGKWEAYERQYNDIKEYFHKWSTLSDKPKNSKAGRSNLSPHVKTYTVTEDNFKTLKWMLMTSANNSHQAWGKYKKYNEISYTIASFEAGIFVAPELLKVTGNTDHKKQVLVPCYGQDDPSEAHLLSENKFKIGIRLPYDTPLEPYGAGDVPWAKPDCDKYYV